MIWPCGARGKSESGACKVTVGVVVPVVGSTNIVTGPFSFLRFISYIYLPSFALAVDHSLLCSCPQSKHTSTTWRCQRQSYSPTFGYYWRKEPCLTSIASHAHHQGPTIAVWDAADSH